MDQQKNTEYQMGYLDGYCDGVRDALSGVVTQYTGISDLPINEMGLSARAINCLLQTGCTTVADAANLNIQTIQSMRNLGVKTSAEIAKWLDEHGFSYTAWSQFL